IDDFHGFCSVAAFHTRFCDGSQERISVPGHRAGMMIIPRLPAKILFPSEKVLAVNLAYVI
ncbi:MAG TPA: hypothetical protein VLM75_00045, partial [Spirochaetota bacterium]|nr:hypothetical protein [Spirochaetota bacterium]